MIDWKSKLSSRKFWVAVIGFITAILVSFGIDDLTVQQITGVVTAGAVLIAYILGEGMVDSAKAKQPIILEPIDDDEEQE